MTSYALAYLYAPNNQTIKLNGQLYASAFLLFCVQGTLSFCMAILKPDVKQAILNILSLSICGCKNITTTCSNGCNSTTERSNDNGTTTITRHGEHGGEHGGISEHGEHGGIE
jgi:hypothetical protein